MSHVELDCVSIINVRMTKMPAAQPLPAILTLAGTAFSRTIRIVARMKHGVVDERTPRSLASVRQYFLKQDAVFFNVLVYLGC
jgi:hypothetical protein